MASSAVRFISVDPGDIDTALHRAAIPEADVSSLKRPETAAREVADVIAAALPGCRRESTAAAALQTA